MKKVILCLTVLCLFTHPVWAKGNAFCDGLSTSNSACVKGVKEMYQGFLNGYADSTIRREQKSKEEALSEIKEQVPYDLFYTFFKVCGERENNQLAAAACLMSGLQEYLLQKKESGEF